MPYVPGRMDGFDELVAETGFSGVVRVDVGGETVLAEAFGVADRAHGVPNQVDTRIGVASAAKGSPRSP